MSIMRYYLFAQGRVEGGQVRIGGGCKAGRKEDHDGRMCHIVSVVDTIADNYDQ